MTFWINPSSSLRPVEVLMNVLHLLPCVQEEFSYKIYLQLHSVGVQVWEESHHSSHLLVKCFLYVLGLLTQFENKVSKPPWIRRFRTGFERRIRAIHALQLRKVIPSPDKKVQRQVVEETWTVFLTGSAVSKRLCCTVMDTCTTVHVCRVFLELYTKTMTSLWWFYALV